LLAILVVALQFLYAPVVAQGVSPNIVFILTDDQRLEDIAHMPRLNKLLIEHGMSFSNYFSSVSLCCPSRASILRGQYAHNTGVLTNSSDSGGFSKAHALGVENSTVATWLHDHNYKTALIGKYLNHYPGSLGPEYIPPGWDYWASSVLGNPYSEYNYTLNENGKQVQYGGEAGDYGTDVYAKKAVGFIKDCTTQNKPFFIYLAFYAPHGPATPAPRHESLFADAKVPRSKAFNEADVSKKPQFIQRLPLLTEKEIEAADTYYGKRLRSLQAVDEAIESICNTLDETKQLENTYIVFASDNGFHLGEHRMRRGKMTAYETDIHLPLIVRGPGVRHGVRAEELAGNIDLAPTFAEIAGAKVPDFVDGRSLLPILRGDAGLDKNWRKVFLVEHWAKGADPSSGNTAPVPHKLSSNCCHNLTACAGNCAHLVKCCCENLSFGCDTGNGGYSGSPAAAVQPGGMDSSCIADKVMEEPDDQIAQTDPEMRDKGTRPSNEEYTPPAPPAARTTHPGRRRRRKRSRSGELSGIPEFHGLRAKGSTYVEYSTGEREYYVLKDDPDEITNIAGTPNVDKKSSESAKDRVEKLKMSAGAAARALEDGH